MIGSSGADLQKFRCLEVLVYFETFDVQNFSSVSLRFFQRSLSLLETLVIGSSVADLQKFRHTKKVNFELDLYILTPSLMTVAHSLQLTNTLEKPLSSSQGPLLSSSLLLASNLGRVWVERRDFVRNIDLKLEHSISSSSRLYLCLLLLGLCPYSARRFPRPRDLWENLWKFVSPSIF